MSDNFTTILNNLQKLDSSIASGAVVQQKRHTSVSLQVLKEIEIELLRSIPSYPQYTKSGKLSKKQLPYLDIGEEAWVMLHVDGLLYIYSFENVGSGYECLADAEEGVHFKFV